MRNHAHQTTLATDVVLSVSGQCDEAFLVVGEEEFAYILFERRVGILMGDGDTASVLYSEYHFMVDTIPAGIIFRAELAEN